MPGTYDRHEISLPCEAASVREARRFVAAHLRRWAVGTSTDDAVDTVDDVLLVASELVGNAVRYCGGGPIKLHIERLPTQVEIAVLDANSDPPTPTEAEPTAESGRGLTIVGALCAEWGVRPIDGHGKAVWGRVAAAALPSP